MVDANQLKLIQSCRADVIYDILSQSLSVLDKVAKESVYKDVCLRKLKFPLYKLIKDLYTYPQRDNILILLRILIKERLHTLGYSVEDNDEITISWSNSPQDFSLYMADKIECLLVEDRLFKYDNSPLIIDLLQEEEISKLPYQDKIMTLEQIVTEVSNRGYFTFNKDDSFILIVYPEYLFKRMGIR